MLVTKHRRPAIWTLKGWSDFRLSSKRAPSRMRGARLEQEHAEPHVRKVALVISH
jgi:hypothetical protein